jgi:hypothetical protein
MAPPRPPAGGPTAGTTTAKADARQPTTQPYGGPNLLETAGYARRWRRHGLVDGGLPRHGAAAKTTTALAEGFDVDQ